MKNSRFAVKTRVLIQVISALVLLYLFFVAFTTSSWHLTQLHFNPYVLISAAALVINLGLLLFFISKPARTDERVWLTLYLSALVIYSGTEMMQRLSGNPTGALFWSGLSSVAVVGAPLIYLFTLSYTNQSERRYPGVTAALLISGLLMLFFEVFTNIIFINDIKYALPSPWGFDLRTAIGPASGALLLWYYAILGSALGRLLSFRHHTRNAILRKQSLVFVVAVSLPLFVGTITDIILPGVGITSIPSFGMVLGVVAGFLMIYGIQKYQYLTISPALFSNTILAIMQEAVVVTDDDFNMIFLNDRAEGLLGTKAESSAKASILGLITHDTLATFKDAFKTDAADTETTTIERIDVQKGKTEPTPVRVTSSRLNLTDFKVRVMVLTDITKELQTRSVIEHEVLVRTEQLHKARAYLVASINSLEQGFVLVDRNSKVEMANSVATRLFQVANVDATGKHLTEVVRAMSWNIDLADVVHKVLDSKHHRLLDAAATDGSFYQIFVTPILAGDRELGATVVIQNVTEQKILDRSKDEFFSIASHELRTPLTAIRGNMSMVKNYYPEAMKDKSLADMVDDAHEASVRLIEIVSDFLDSSKLEQGKMEFTIKPVAVQPLVAAAQNDLRSLLDKAHDTITLVGLDKLPMAKADEGRLRQILYNLLSNAIKYSENATITVSGEADAQTLYLRVTDTGKGISAENQKLLFHKFQQAGDSILTRDDTKGTGLGLYISRLLATNMHGNVELEHTELGKGSTFMVTLPVAKDQK